MLHVHYFHFEHLTSAEKYGSPSPEEWGSAFLQAWDAAITQIAPMAKEPGFSGEREYRIIRQLQIGELHKIRLAQKTTMMSRHLPIRFPKNNETLNPKLPIAKIIVGPSRHRAITRISVDVLLRQLGYSEGLVSSSQRPFQAT